MIGDELIVELKATEAIKGIHEAQLLTYMRLADIREGLLISSNVQLPKDEERRPLDVCCSESSHVLCEGVGQHRSSS